MPGSLTTPSAQVRPRDPSRKGGGGIVVPRFDSSNAKRVATDAFNKASGGNAQLHVDLVCGLMKQLGFFQNQRNMRRDLVVALGQMGDPSTFVSRGQFVNWYVANVADFGGSQLNRLLVKDQLGKSRTPTYQLPGDNFTYGHVNKWDAEGAGQVALTWVKGKLSGTRRGKRNIVAENKASVSKGAPRGKALSKYRAANPKYFKAPEVHRASRRTNPYSDKNLCYGRASEASESVGNVMKPSNRDVNNYDANYPDMSGQEMPGKMPLPRPTHSSKLLAKYSRASGSNSGSTFKMKKFKRVEGRVNSYNSRRGVNPGSGRAEPVEAEPSSAQPLLVDDEITKLLDN